MHLVAPESPPCSLWPSRPQALAGTLPCCALRCCAAGVEIAQLVAGEAAAVVHAARTWTPADLAQAPAGNLARAPMLDALLPDGRARFVDGALSPRLDAVRCSARVPVPWRRAWMWCGAALGCWCVLGVITCSSPAPKGVQMLS